MRVTNMVPDVQYALQQSQQSLATALQQLTTSQRVNQLSDDPAASATMVGLLTGSANEDQYTKNVSSVTAQMQTADTAMSAVVTALNQAVTLGTQGAGGTLSAANRQSVVTQLQSVLSSVVSQANSTYQGAYLFGGSATSTPPFSPTGVYSGNSIVSTVRVGDSMTVQTNLPGDQVFTSGANVIGSLQNLIVAVQGGATAAIGTATAAITTALNYVGEQRVSLDNTVSQLNSQESYLGQESITLLSQQKALVGIDISLAATNLSQATLTHSAVLAAAGKVLPQTLLDYLK